MSFIVLFCCKATTETSLAQESNVVLKSESLKRIINEYLSHEKNKKIDPDKNYLILAFEKKETKTKVEITNGLLFGHQYYKGHFGVGNYGKYKIYFYGDIINELLIIDRTKPVKEYEVDGALFDYNPYYLTIEFDENYNIIKVYDLYGDIKI